MPLKGLKRPEDKGICHSEHFANFLAVKCMFFSVSSQGQLLYYSEKYRHENSASVINSSWKFYRKRYRIQNDKKRVMGLLEEHDQWVH